MNARVGQERRRLAAADAGDVRLEVFVAGHRHLAAEVLDGAHPVEAVVTAERGFSLMGEDVTQEGFLHFTGPKRGRLEVRQPPANRPGDQLEGDPGEQESGYALDAVPD